MKTKNLKEKGITLIALVITIIVLLILAGVTISIAMKTGIMDKAEKAVDMYSEEEALETLKISLLDYKAGKIMKEETRELVPYLNANFKDAYDIEGTNYCQVTVNGWIFWVEKTTYEVIKKGPATGPVPTINSVESTPAGDSTYVTLTVSATPVKGGALTITVMGNGVEKIDATTFKVTKNGTYVVIVEETDVTRKATKVEVVEGIIGPSYLVTLDGKGKINVTGAGRVEQGKNTTIKAEDTENYKFTGWNVTSGNANDVTSLSSAETTVTPTGNITIEAYYKRKDLVTTLTGEIQTGRIDESITAEIKVTASVNIGTVANIESINDGAIFKESKSNSEKIFKLNGSGEYYFKVTTTDGDIENLGIKIETKKLKFKDYDITGKSSNTNTSVDPTWNDSYLEASDDEILIKAPNGIIVRCYIENIDELSQFNKIIITSKRHTGTGSNGGVGWVKGMSSSDDDGRTRVTFHTFNDNFIRRDIYDISSEITGIFISISQQEASIYSIELLRITNL